MATAPVGKRKFCEDCLMRRLILSALFVLLLLSFEASCFCQG